MKLNNKINWALAILLLAVMAFVLLPVALASDDDRDGGDATATAGADSSSVSGADAVANAMTGDLIGGDSTLSTSNKTFAFSHSLGDVDINEGKNCLGSEAWGSFIISRQTNELNPWCAALFYELNGKHEFAAKMRCDIKEISKKYETELDCWRDQDLTPREGSSGAADAIVDHIDEAVEKHDEDLMGVQIAQSDLEQRIEALEHKPAPRPTIVQQQAPPPPEQYTDEDRVYILGLYSKEEEDDE